MKYVIIYWIAGLLLVGCFAVLYFSFKNINKSLPQETMKNITNIENSGTTMKLKSTAFEDGEEIPSRYTCDGQNINPPLDISNIPSAAKSLVIIMDDHDVPKNIRLDGVWDHLVVFNIPSTISVINEQSVIPGTYGKNSSGTNKYIGPCPPDREHRYTFYLYALDSELPLSANATKNEVLNAISGHILAETKLVGRYNRRK